MSQSETFWQITRHDYTKIMLLLETSEQRLDGLRKHAQLYAKPPSTYANTSSGTTHQRSVV